MRAACFSQVGSGAALDAMNLRTCLRAQSSILDFFATFFIKKKSRSIHRKPDFEEGKTYMKYKVYFIALDRKYFKF